MHRGLIALGLLAGVGYCILCDASSPHKVAAPAPENSTTVSFASGNAVLAGTVLHPETAGPAPGLVLLTGSGPGFRAELYPIAQRFREEGFFVLVYDKRGTGESTGSWAQGVLEERASDAAIAVDYLRAYPGVDSDQVGVWGVSQAGWVMPVMARRMENPPAFMIVVTGGGAGPRESELWSYEGALSHDGFVRDEVPEAFALLDQYFEYLATGEGYAELVAAVEQSREAPWYPALNLHRILVSPGSRSQWAWVATHDPAPFIADLSLPVLVLIGAHDPFQPAARSESLWRTGLASGSSISKVVVFENAGHGVTVGDHSNELTENVYAEGYWETQLEWLARVSPGHATEWNVHGSEGLDAVLFVGVLSGDKLQADIYEKQVADFKPRLPENTVEAIDDLATRITHEGKLFGPLMVLYASAGPLQTLADVRASMERPENLRPALEASPYWDEEGWTWFVNDAAPAMAGILRALETAGFREWYAQEIVAELEPDIERFQREATNYDVVSEQSRLLGRTLDPEIEVILVAFSQPYGIKIIGQRFLNYHGYPSAITLRTAAHEMFHPGVDREDAALWALLEPLRKDPFMRNIVDTHDPAFGYNSFEGIVDEDSAQALDQLVSERLGIAHDAARRWQHSDGGMHMLAAALYQAMKDDGFPETGGIYQDWLKLALQRGLLDPDDIIRRATEIVGEATVQKWLPETDTAER